MSTQKHKITKLQQELEQSSQIRKSSWKNLQQNGLTAISTAAIIVA
jgi:phosphotransferase system IIB component